LSELLNHPPGSICLLRLSALGDVTHVLPIVHTIRRHWPNTHLTWIIGETEARMLEGLKDVEFIILEKKKGLRGYSELRKRLSGRRFDVLLAMQLSLRANAIIPLVKAPVKVGYDWRRSRDLHQLVINRRIPWHSGQHVLDIFFSFIEALGLHERELMWEIPIPDEAERYALEHLRGEQKTLVISPCSSHPLRNWESEHYADVADYAISHYGMRIILVGGSSALERRIGDEIKSAMRGSVIDLIAKDTLKQLLAVLRRATIVLSPDSGPAHMANAVGTPVIALHAASNSLRSGPYSNLGNSVDRYDEAARLYFGKPAAELRWGTKIERREAMNLIRPEDVYAKIETILARLATKHG